MPFRNVSPTFQEITFEKTVDKVGAALLGVTAAGIAAHGIASVIKRPKPEDE
jgi:Ni,Fe-hydrogenase I small subunit